MIKPPVLILHANGTNRDREAGLACRLAGGEPVIVHINQLLSGERRLSDFRMLVLPGGFSYGDDLGAGQLWALTISHCLADSLSAFVDSGRPVLGICNGFQTLVKSTLLPGGEGEGRSATLTRNDSGRFECRWVLLQPQTDSPCVFTAGLQEPISCPVAHGEGKFVARDEDTLAALESRGQVALRYVATDGGPPAYPENPNGSQGDIAGICNPRGNVLGLMPHPEDHVFGWQHPRAHRGEHDGLGLALFENGVRYAAEV